MKAKYIVPLLIIGSLLTSVGLISQRLAVSFINRSIQTALNPVSTDITNLQQSLLGFEQDLVSLKQQPTLTSTPPAATAAPTAPTATATSSAPIQPDTATPAPAAVTAAAIPPTSGKLINLNTASLSELDSLPGIGAAYAQRIIEARPFSSVDQLDRVKGIGSKTIDKLRPLVTI